MVACVWAQGVGAPCGAFHTLRLRAYVPLPGPLDGVRAVRGLCALRDVSFPVRGPGASGLCPEPGGPLLPALPVVPSVLVSYPYRALRRSRGVCTRGVHGTCPERSRDDATSPPTDGRCKSATWNGWPRQVAWRACLTPTRIPPLHRRPSNLPTSCTPPSRSRCATQTPRSP